MKRSDKTLKEYHISKARYNELVYFCMQYQEKKEILENSYGLNATVNDGVPHASATNSPTESKAIRNERLRKDLELIEQTAIEAAPEIYEYILKNVTEGIDYKYLGVPLSKNRFSDARKYFFFLLSQKR